RDREARRHGDPEVDHLGEVRALAAEEVLHRGVAVGLPLTEEVEPLRAGRRSIVRLLGLGRTAALFGDRLWIHGICPFGLTFDPVAMALSSSLETASCFRS